MKKSPVKKLVLVLLLALAFTTWVFHYIGIVDIVGLSFEIGAKIPVLNKYLKPQTVTALEIQKDELYFLQRAIEEKEMELQEKEQLLKIKENEIDESGQQLDYTKAQLIKRQKEIEEKEKQARAVNERIAKLVELYQNMPPDNAAAILDAKDAQTGEEKVSDEIIISILENMDAASASYILSRMDATRVSVITRKMLTALN